MVDTATADVRASAWLVIDSSARVNHRLALDKPCLAEHSSKKSFSSVSSPILAWSDSRRRPAARFRCPHRDRTRRLPLLKLHFHDVI